MKSKLQAYGICVVYYVLVSHGFVHATLSINDTLDSFETRDATANEDNIEGYIEYANPPDACSGISLPNFPQNFTMKKIVLINGTTTCDFFTKVQNAKQVGYDVAVLFDPSPGPFEYPNITFPVPISEVNASVFLVSFKDGIVIRDQYLYHMRDKEHYKIVIFAPTPLWKQTMYLGLISGLTGGLLTVFCILVYSCIRKSYAYCFRDEDEDENEELQIDDRDLLRRRFLLALLAAMNGQEREQGSGLRNEPRSDEERLVALSNLKRRFPSQVFSKAHPFENCIICRSNFELEEHIRVLACSHAYHTDCVDEWLVDSNEVCPQCKRIVNLEDSIEHSVSDPTESTRLLTSPFSRYYSVRTGNDSGPSNALDAVYDNPLTISDESDELWVDAQGSINSFQMNESDDDDQQRLMV